MLKVYNQNLEPLAILDNAFDIGYEKGANELSFLPFCMPIDDLKNEECLHFNYIEAIGKSGRNYGMYRIMPTKTIKHKNRIDYECEHVFATLWDDIMDTDDTNGYVQFTNREVREVLETILSFQTTENWVLGVCEFPDIDSHGFENESGLYKPFMSVLEGLNQPYDLVFHTDSYPFVVDVLRADNEIKSEYRWGKDICSFEKISDPTNIINYVIPKGYGEGINALTIKEVNNGVKYLKDQASIDKWGKKGIIKVDRRFKNAAALKKYGERILAENKDPKFTIECKAVDLSIKPEYAHERRFLNTMANVIVGDEIYPVRIVKETIKDIMEKEWDVDYELGNKLEDASTDAAGMRDRQDNIEGYSKGNTNQDSQNRVDNADPDNPVVFRIFIPDDVVNINTMDLTYETSEFTGYMKGSEAGGAYIKSSVVQSKSTESGGGETTSQAPTATTSAGGGSSYTSEFSQPTFFKYTSIPLPYEDPTQHIHALEVEPDDLKHRHTFTTQNHSHTVPAHSHLAPAHTHNFSVNIPAIDIPSHTHPPIYGIYKHDSLPTEIEITVDGTIIPQNALSGENIDLVPYLSKDGGGRIQRGSWHEIKLRPVDELALINATLIQRLFVSSHIGGVY